MKSNTFSNQPPKVLFWVVSFLTLTLLLTSCGNPYSKNTENSESGRHIFNGKRVTRKEADRFASILKLAIDDDTDCTGTYLGQAIILTAYHCVGLNHTLKEKDLPTIKVSAFIDFATSRSSRADELEVLVAPKAKEKVTANGKVQIPDIVLLKFKGDFAKELEGIPAAKIAMTPLMAQEKDAFIAGFGKDQFDPEISAKGLLNYSSAKIIASDEYTLTSEFKAGNAEGIILPGDSGGPLYKWENNQIVVYGVASSVNFDRFQVAVEGTADTATSTHSRTDIETVRLWIEKALNPSSSSLSISHP